MLGVSKAFGAGPEVVRDVSFSLSPGEFLTLLGPSGSGKTTTLMMVAGFEQPSRGDIRISGRSVLAAPPERRNLGVVFQQYALFPHMTARENVEFPLRMRSTKGARRRDQALEMLDKVGLRSLAERKPRELSGGQQQRVALARALIFEPSVLLLDEPLGALDKRLRESLQLEIKALQARVGVSILFVTHDQEEAMMMSDRIAVMNEGQIVQVGTPDLVYSRPCSPFVANFLGECNLIACQAEALAEDTTQLVFADATRVTVEREPGVCPAQNSVVSVRPERLRFVAGPEDAQNSFRGVVTSRVFLGSSTRFTVDALGSELVVRETDLTSESAPKPGDPITLGFDRADAQVLDAEYPGAKAGLRPSLEQSAI